MSFSTQIKSELRDQTPKQRHCQLAELAALLSALAGWEGAEGDKTLVLSTENVFVARKCFTLLEKSLKVEIGVKVRSIHKRQQEGRSGAFYQLSVTGEKQLSELCGVLKLSDPIKRSVDERLIKSSCCRRAALRGYFLACGSMSDPSKGYHLELAAATEETAGQIIDLMGDFDLEGKQILRKNHRVVYLKDGEGIADFLKVVDAGKALLEFENTRIYKDMRGRINRKVNCEAANISKTVTAAARQVEDIQLIEKTVGLSSLSPSLRQMAYIRLENPEASLEELGKLADPPVGKSGVNHRLRKLSLAAERLR